MKSTSRRFPPPWSVEGTDACFIVRDHNGQALAYVSVVRDFETGGGLNQERVLAHHG